jgi:hypothetical protein
MEKPNMHVAGLELCKTLHELSGWRGTYAWYMKFGGHLGKEMRWTLGTEATGDFPAYDCGYLIRKLQPEIRLHPDYGYAERIACADNPEDEAAAICIGLIKGGYLT